MAEEKVNNGRWTPIVTALALVAGIAAVITPMYGALDSMQKQLDEAKVRIKENELARGTVQTQLAAMQVQFIEVETQFRGAKEQLAGVAGLIDSRLEALDEKLQGEIAAQATAAEIVRRNQEGNIAGMQDLKVRISVAEQVLFGKKAPDALAE